ncbi:MAG: hypothetical protein JXQ73_09085 [Phycisphaerae bacterium]|nr:hypothetical protein [Phycisphaerae bacterium]
MRRLLICLAFCVVVGIASDLLGDPGPIDLSRAAVVVREGVQDPSEKMAGHLFVDEVAKRTGLRLRLGNTWPAKANTVIAICTRGGKSSWSNLVPRSEGKDLPELKPEGFAIRVVRKPNEPNRDVVFVIGVDGRGVIFGVGRLLREMSWRRGGLAVKGTLDVSTSPTYPIRGHQLGYRHTANSYDAWTPVQYEQYIRELIVFGANCIEDIPFQDAPSSPVMPVARKVMNLKVGEICARYGIDHWAWTPADFSLKDAKRRQAELDRNEDYYRSCPRLDHVFVPGGDPGDNPVELLMPYLKDLHARLVKHHPKAGVWVSLQGFSPGQVKAFHDIVNQQKPGWLAGVVAGPSSPPIPETRVRLPRSYRLRWYPDITHCVLSQFEVHYWDPAFALTLGREPVNPRPVEYAGVFRFWAPHTDGFLTYSDGINDDVNKAVWSQLGWSPERDVREILVEYGRFFFGSKVGEAVADGLLALEYNWKGSLGENPCVLGALKLWQQLEKEYPELLDDWRFQVHLMRAYYDAYVRARLLNETRLEKRAMAVLGEAKQIGAEAAMDKALQVLSRSESQPFRPKTRRRIEELAEAAFRSIGLQTSVKRYHARNAERGAVLDFLDRPLNNRWWLEDEFAEIRKLGDEKSKLARLEVIRTWEHPGEKSFYDDIGHVGKSPHVIQTEGANTDPEMVRHDGFSHSTHWNGGMSRRRLSWLHHMRWPAGLLYEGVDPTADYVVRLTGKGMPKLRADGELLKPSKTSENIGEFKEYPIPKKLTADGKLKLTFDAIDESRLNWRQHSHVAEVWVLKR